MSESIELGRRGWTLRAWRADDAASLQPLGNDERIARWMADSWPMPYTAADAQWWVETGSREFGSCWAICLNDRPQGGCGVNPGLGFLRCNAEIGWWLNPDHWGQGLAVQAGRHCIEHALAQTEITRIFAAVHGGNERSMRVAGKLGMTLEGVQRQGAIKQGRVIDRHIYAIYRA
ncbi:RimJ/RimL family protein N-acetyltransferase [Inhella inkyongensis]|uniref:RimJ/RimL family protein N-acetyltransferase n=1 Tax=Inhella inkyongensis TaxID=392593 RepID=A0A840S5G3_9BURK|nr:GNAT family protein [Inhella inkyongensis]MBB5204812.1 RimJ/RimL family protein N-acetyltransferase [Inhella inkyongensis]